MDRLQYLNNYILIPVSIEYMRNLKIELEVSINFTDDPDRKQIIHKCTFNSENNINEWLVDQSIIGLKKLKMGKKGWMIYDGDYDDLLYGFYIAAEICKKNLEWKCTECNCAECIIVRESQ